MAEAEPRLTAATLDGPCRVTLRFNRRVNVEDWPASRFSLKTMDGQTVAIRSVESAAHRHEQTAAFWLETAEPLDFVHHAFEASVERAGSRLVSVRDVLQDAQLYGDVDARMGCICSPESTTFRLFAPTATGVEVVIAEEVTGDRGLVAHAMQHVGKGIWEVTVAGDWHGKFYAYRMSGIGFNPTTEISDAYALCAQGRQQRTVIVDLRRTDPPGFREWTYANPSSPVDAIVYEMHVRDFTIATNSGAAHPGKYLGLTEAGTYVRTPGSRVPPGAAGPSATIATGIDHLVELGVTHVQLMPVYDFDNSEQ
ncbi:MAG: hypothetical protein FWC56_01025, partial [Phycisphaerae bacterium]|nr:hypothetical protein [Phycisphaerae bacterium]